MNVLVFGGTGFIGRHIVEALLAGGHVVSTFARGTTLDELPAGVERLRGDRDVGVVGLAALLGRAWDACLDVSAYTPRQVRPSAEMLRASVKRYLFISAVAVYGDPVLRPVREDHPRMPPANEDVVELNGQTYGAAKVACENIVAQVYGERCTILRPQIVVGPHDPSGRYTYWIERAALGGAMLAPGDGSDHLQLIDVRDLARFARTAIKNDLGGAFNLAGPRITWLEFMRILGAKNLVWVPAQIIQSSGVTEFELPLYRPERGARSGLMDVSNDKARRSGLTLTDPEVTLADTRDWMRGRE